MKTKIVLLFLLGWNSIVWGQDSVNIKQLDNILNILVEKDYKYVSTGKNKKFPLVSAYTFTQMVKKDFSTLITGSPENNQVGKYAALSIDKTEQSFSFSPVTYVFNGDDGTKPFNNILAINANGKLNNDGFFDFSNRKKFKIGISWTHLFGISTYNYLSELPKYKEIYQCVKEDIIKKQSTENVLEKLSSIGKDESDYKKMYHQEVEKYENMTYKKYWTIKFLVWTKLDIGYSEDRLKIVDSINTINSITKPMDENINGSYFSFSGNAFWGHKNGFSFYANAQISCSKKTSLSEIFSTVEWNKIHYANETNNTIYYNLSKENVYITNTNNFFKRYKVDWSFQLLTFFPAWKDNLVGLDLNYQNKGFITPGTETSTSTKNIFSIGIMFPLKDKNGNITINIEPFWQTISYNNYDSGENESFLGIKFGVPLNQLF